MACCNSGCRGDVVWCDDGCCCLGNRLTATFSLDAGTLSLLTEFPHMTMLTSQVHDFCPGHFGHKYFGSD